MTLLFWGIAALMVLAALALVAPPLLRSYIASGPARRDLNLAVHRDRLAELEAEREEGSLSEAQYRQAKEELERELLSDTTGEEQAMGQGAGRAPLIVLALLLPLLTVGTYLLLGSPETVGVDMVAKSRAAAGEVESVEEMVNQLERRLEAEPDNPEGWVMLARSYRALDRYDASARAFGRAFDLVGDGNADLNANYAQALALAEGNDLGGRPMALIERALELEPEHEHALWLAGIGSFQQGEAEAAIGYWERVRALQEEGSEGYERATAFIEQARAQEAGRPESAAAAQGAGSGAEAGPSITVAVSLDPALAAHAEPEDVLFVYARAASGPRTPLAMAATQVKALPVRLVLDDRSAMVPGADLSSAGEVIVTARISRSGDAAVQPGDLVAESAPLPVGEGAEVALVIDRRVAE